MKKLIAAILALTLFLSLSFSAPAEGRLYTLMESLHSLLFNTINVTISGEAVFSLDGERFKTAEILYKQAGEDSHWQLDLKTPRRYRADQETGSRSYSQIFGSPCGFAPNPRKSIHPSLGMKSFTSSEARMMTSPSPKAS